MALSLACVRVSSSESVPLLLAGPGSASVYSEVEATIDFTGPLAALSQLPDDQVFDAYDADQDGTWIRLSATFCNDHGSSLVVPGFAMRDHAMGPWLWRVRWMPLHTGIWSMRVSCEAALHGRPFHADVLLGHPIRIFEEPWRVGPLVAAGPAEDPRWIRRRQPDGSTTAAWLFGACRAWDVASDPHGASWSSSEGIDRSIDLFPVLRSSGYNLLNQWMAPWEYLLVHRDRAEHWREGTGIWHRVAIAPQRAWNSWDCIDQGRAAAFDDLVRQCSGDRDHAIIQLLLSPLPHQCFEMAAHSWGEAESGWSIEDDSGKRLPEQLNGFSSFPVPQEPMKAWQFFAADPKALHDSWQARLFDAQANYERYVIARWSSSPALGIWVLMDELDGVGDEHGLMASNTGWWRHPECSQWLANLVRLMRGTLVRQDGLAYMGDPYRHPLHAATTSFITELDPGSNLEWQGGPSDARLDLIGWHWYPTWSNDATFASIWTRTIDGIIAFATRSGTGARLISEFGAPDRNLPGDLPSRLYPTLYHMGIWASLFAGQAGTVMDWDDGKEFGELAPRASPGPFDQAHYPVDNAAQLRALRRFLGTQTPEHLEPCRAPGAIILTSEQANRALALSRALPPHPNPAAVHLVGWLYAPAGSGHLQISGLHPGPYQVDWYDPWTGLRLPGPPTLFTVNSGIDHASIDAANALMLASTGIKTFPNQSQEDRGKDVAFIVTGTGSP
jgi:hypothetical protein